MTNKKYSYLNKQILTKFKKNLPKDIELIEEEITYEIPKTRLLDKSDEFTYYLYTFIKQKDKEAELDKEYINSK